MLLRWGPVSRHARNSLRVSAWGWTLTLVLGVAVLSYGLRRGPCLRLKKRFASFLTSYLKKLRTKDIQYHIYVREKVEKGLQDIRDGRVLTEEEFEQRAAKWFADYPVRKRLF